MLCKLTSIVVLILVFGMQACSTDTISVMDFADHQIFQRTVGGTSASVMIGGIYSGTPTSIQARVIKASDASTVVDWTTIVSSPSGSAFSGKLVNVPQGGWYHVEVRYGNKTSVVSKGKNNWGIGIIVGIIGQSLGELWSRNSTGSSLNQAPGCQNVNPYPLLSYYWENRWSFPASKENCGAITFGNTLITALGIPVGIANYALGGVGLMSECSTKQYGAFFLGGPPLYSPNKNYYADFINAVKSIGGNIEFVIWIGSEADWMDRQDHYKGALKALYAYLKRDIRPDIPLIVNGYGSVKDPGYSFKNLSGWPIIRDQTIHIADSTPGMYVGAQSYDFPLATANIHYSCAGFITHGQRMAQTVLYILGKSTYYRGPQITGFTRSDANHVNVSILHHGGTDFSPASGLKGFQLFDGGKEVKLTNVARLNNNTIQLTAGTALSPNLEVRYMFDNNPMSNLGVTQQSVMPYFSDGVYDNSPLQIPLEPYISTHPPILSKGQQGEGGNTK